MYSAIGRIPFCCFGFILQVLLLFSRPAVFSQSNDTKLQGHVADNAGSVLLGASVALSNLSTGLERVEITDASGTLFSARFAKDSIACRQARSYAPVSREVVSNLSERLNLRSN